MEKVNTKMLGETWVPKGEEPEGGYGSQIKAGQYMHQGNHRNREVLQSPWRPAGIYTYLCGTGGGLLAERVRAETEGDTYVELLA